MKKLYVSLLTLATGAMSMVYAQDRGGCLSIMQGCPEDIVVPASASDCGAVVNFDSPIVLNYCNSTQQSVTYNFTGDVQTFTVPVGVYTITIDANGGQGGAGHSGGNWGGLGGRTIASIDVTPGQVLHIYVGGMGTNGSDVTPGTIAPGGWNGGGYGGFDSDAWQPEQIGGGGGGASDIRWAENTTLEGRIMVAAGGGGGAGGWGGPAFGGNGGGLTGDAGGFTVSAMGGGGGTQSAGGSVDNIYGATNGTLGFGGNGASNVVFPGAWGSGGGGAGYYGGAGGTNTQLHGSGYSGAGGGGSSFISNDFYGHIMMAGFNSGNGQVTITYNQPELLTSDVTEGLSSGSVFPLGTTTVTLQASGNGETYTCSFTVTVESDLDATSTTTVETEGNDGSINLTVSGGVAPYTYDWSGPNGFSADTEDLSSIVAGDYEVEITDAIGCTYVHTVTVGSVVGLAELNESMFNVFPNPTTGSFTIQTSVNGRVEILGTNGQLVASETIEAGDQVKNLNQFESGVYTIRMISENGVSIKKLVLQK
jgi:hypothetical protein